MKIKKLELFFLLLIFIITVAARFLKITEIPNNITGDEVNFLLESLRITLNKGKGIFALCEPGQQPCFNDYLTALPLKILGYKNAALAIRLPSLVLSSLMVLPFYLILRQNFSAFTSLITTLLFATSYWNLNFSRSAWNTIQPVFYFLMFILLYERWLRLKKLRYLISAALFSGLMFYGYHAGKYFLVIFFTYSIFSAIYPSLANKKQRRQIISSFFIVSLITLLLSLPQLVFILKNRNLFLLRPRAVSIFSIKNYPVYHGCENLSEIIKYQANNSLRGILFLDKVDNADVENLRYLPGGSPLVDLATRAFVLFGLLLSLTQFRPLSLLFWIYSSYLVNIFLISIITTEPPNSNRLIMMIPILYFLVGVAINFLSKSRLFQPIIVLICMIIIIANLNIYFHWAQSKELENARHPALEYEDVATWIKLQIPIISRNSSEVIKIEHRYLINFR